MEIILTCYKKLSKIYQILLYLILIYTQINISRKQLSLTPKEKNIMVKDLVCGMDVDPSKTKFESEHDGKKYYFCAKHCKMQFDKEPKKYVK